MDSFIQKLEQLITKQMEELEKSPIKQGLKILLIVWVVKKIIKWSKDND